MIGRVFAAQVCAKMLFGLVSMMHAGLLSAQISLSTNVTSTDKNDQSSNSASEIRAQLQPRQYTTIAAEIGAKVNQVPFEESRAFKKGELLLAFDCNVQEAGLKRARAEHAAAMATLRSNKRLIELKSIGQLEYDQSKAAVDKFAAEIGAQEAVISKCRIYAPYSGRVAEQTAREQQYVQPGQPLLEIIDDSVLELVFLVPSGWLKWLYEGQVFSVEIDETKKRYPAKFVRIGARVDPVSQSVKVAAAVDGHFPELKVGMSGKVMIDIESKK